MRTLLLSSVFILVASCSAGEVGYAIDFDLLVHSSVSDADLARIETLRLRVSGAEASEQLVAVAGKFATREELLRYKPGPTTSGTLDFEFTLTSDTGDLIASATELGVPAEPDSHRTIEVTLRAPSVPVDLSMPADLTPPTDAQEDTDASSDMASHTPSCFGRPFDPPTLVGTAEISASINVVMWGIRPVGANAYFAAIPTGSDNQQLFRATFSGLSSGAPSLSNATVLDPPSSADIEWAPSLAPDGSFLVFSMHALPRDLYYAVSTGGSFGTPFSITSLNTGTDESDPYVLPNAMYYSHEAASGSFELWRSELTQGPTFAPGVRIDLACPQFHCNNPVVPSDERSILYSSWTNSGGFLPNVQESTLTIAGNTVTAGPPVGHPELGSRYPSWISDDGCTVLLGGSNISTINDMYWARRTPQ